MAVAARESAVLPAALDVGEVLGAFGFGLQVFVGWTVPVGDPNALTGVGRALYFGGVDLLPLIVPAVSGGMGSWVVLMKLI